MHVSTMTCTCWTIWLGLARYATINDDIILSPHQSLNNQKSKVPSQSLTLRERHYRSCSAQVLVWHCTWYLVPVISHFLSRTQSRTIHGYFMEWLSLWTGESPDVNVFTNMFGPRTIINNRGGLHVMASPTSSPTPHTIDYCHLPVHFWSTDTRLRYRLSCGTSPMRWSLKHRH